METLWKPLLSPICPHSTSISPPGACRHLAEEKQPPDNSKPSGRSSPARGKVAVDLRRRSAPSLLLGVLCHPSDLTPSLICLAETCRHCHHHHLPESTSATSSSLRELQSLHASHLDPEPLLRTSATNLAAADSRSFLGEPLPAKP
jgi:hypothetical protein